LDEALASSRQAVSCNPNHVGANLLLADIWLAKNQPIEARNTLEDLYLHNQTTAVREKLIQVLLVLVQFDKKASVQLRYYRRILKLDNEHQEAKTQIQRIEQQIERANQVSTDEKPGEVEKPTKLRRFKRVKNWLSQIALPLGKSLTWLAFTVFFGLLFPIGLVWLDSYLTTQYFSFNSFLRSVTLMLFAMAVVASITLDYHLSTQTFGQRKFLDGFLFTIFPSIIIVTCVALFYIPYKEPSEKINFEQLRIIEIYILLGVFFNGIIVKFNAFKN